MQYLPFCDWLMSLSIMSSQFIHIVTNRRLFFIFKTEQYTLYVYTTFSLSINLLMDVGRFRILLTVNNTAMNLGEETTLPCAQLCNLQPSSGYRMVSLPQGFPLFCPFLVKQTPHLYLLASTFDFSIDSCAFTKSSCKRNCTFSNFGLDSFHLKQCN